MDNVASFIFSFICNIYGNRDNDVIILCLVCHKSEEQFLSTENAGVGNDYLTNV